MASLSTGSVNFPTIVYENPPTLVDGLAGQMRRTGCSPEIEIFDLSHLHGAKRLVEQGLIDERPHVQFVMGVQNAMPAEEQLLDILLEEATPLLPEGDLDGGRHRPASGGGDGLGAGARRGCGAHRARGQHPDHEGPACASNAELARLAVEAIASHGGRAATPDQARTALCLRPAAVAA